MSKSERFLLILALAVGCLALLMGRGNGLLSAAMAQAEAGSDEATDATAVAPAAGPIAYVSGFQIMFDLLESDRYKPAMEDLQAEAQAAVAMFDEQMNDLRTEFEAIDQSDADAMAAIQQRAQEIQTERQRVDGEWRQRIVEAQQQNFQEAYEEVLASAEAIADAAGYDYVLLGAEPDADLNEGMSGNPAQELLLRTVLVAPDGTDITADVRADLNLD